MKNFKEFIEDFKNEEISMTYTDKLVAYAAYCQGYIEGIGHERRMPVVMPPIPNYPLPEEATRITCNTETEQFAKERSIDEIPGVIIVTDEIKKMFPELKNISMIQTEPVSDKTWPEAMEYAKNLKLGGFTDWRLPTCSDDEDDETANNELRGIWRASEALGILVDYRWYWSGTEFDARSAWYVYFSSSGGVGYGNKSNAGYVRCVR